MSPSQDLSQIVTAELLLVREKLQSSLYEGSRPVPDALDAYVSALIGHLFAMLLTRQGPVAAVVARSPEALADALNIIARKMGIVAENLDPAAEYKIQVFRRERTPPADPA